LYSIFLFALALVFLPRAEAQKGLPSAQIPIGNDDTRPQEILISGTVVLEDGKLPVGAEIEMDCRGSVTRETNVGPDGRFAFRLGDSIRSGRQLQDASQDTADPFGRDSGMNPLDIGPYTVATRVQRMPSKSKLLGCTLRASLGGYKSSEIQLDAAPVSMLSNIGTIVLFPIERMRGSNTSATSLLAPKSAKKAMDKAKEALRKDRINDSEKYLKSAIAIYPKYGEAWFHLGRLYQTQNRFKEARDAYAKAIEIDTLYVQPYIWLGWLSAAEQKWQETADISERALALDPATFPEAYYLNALAAFNLKDPVVAEKRARQAEQLDSENRYPKVHLILASILSSRNDIVGLIEELRKYVKYSPRRFPSLQDYGQATFLDATWDTAGDSGKKELASRSGAEVRLALAAALIGAGMAEQAKSELAIYLKDHDITSLPPQMRALVVPVQDRKKDETVSVPANERTESQRDEPIDYLRYFPSDLPGFEAATDQAPMGSILTAVGENVSKLFADLFNISAVEIVEMEKIDGRVKAAPDRKYEYLYLCLGATGQQGLHFNEYRSDAQGHEIRQAGLGEGYMLTSGFISAPLIFHPIYQNENSFRFVGYQKLGGRNTIVIAYAQIPERCRLSGRFQVGNKMKETFKQGLAWIDAENYQIIRLTSELLQPLPQIGLEKLKTQIDFDEVRLNQALQKFWLPVQVVVTAKWNGRVLRNTHSYSDFRLFDVETSQKINRPKDSENAIQGPLHTSPVDQNLGTSSPPSAHPAK
jgi:tetratricopeptide (TPR) repeat protein